MKKYDLVVYGASGFTGKQVARYLDQKKGARLHWAIAGRSRSKLELLASQLSSKPAVECADSSSYETLKALAEKTRVLITTVGPYDLYGEPVVRACVESGTDYVDITGETPFVRQMIHRFHDQAKQQGTRIVPFCGFDSVPSDIGTFCLVRRMQKDSGVGAQSVDSFFKIKGGFNGGTIASALNMAEAGESKQVMDPLILNPENHKTEEDRRRGRPSFSVEYHRELERWTMPFFMAPINSAVVRRSHALFADVGEGYEDQFSYREKMLAPRRLGRLTAHAVTLGSVGFMQALNFEFGRKVVKRLAPAPGEGPSDEVINGGYFRCTLLGASRSGHRRRLDLDFAGDPGNKATVTFLAEAALTLLEDREQLPGGAEYGGILTPATALGHPYVMRLQKAGLRFKWS